MDIISYGAASKERRRAATLAGKLGDGVEGTSENLQDRLKALTDSMDDVTRLADNVIVRDAVNLMKAEARLNTIVQAKKYGMDHMVFDDLLDLSGIDTVNSTGYVHDAVKGEIMGGSISTKDIPYQNMTGVLIVEDKISMADMTGPEVVEEVPLSQNPNFSRIGRQASLGIVIPGQSFVSKKDMLLKSIEVYLEYGGGEPGDIKLSLQKGVTAPGIVQPISESVVPRFRESGVRKCKFVFNDVFLKEGELYLFYFTTTQGTSTSIENYKIFTNMEHQAISGSEYYAKIGAQEWSAKTSGTGSISFIVKKETTQEEEKKEISFDGGLSWRAYPDGEGMIKVGDLSGIQSSDKYLKLRIKMNGATVLRNYGLIWT